MPDISKSDWNLFRERLPKWQENYMDRLLKEYSELINSSEKPSERFWKLEERLKMDRKHPGVILSLRKSEAMLDIAAFVKQDVITMDDLDGFSQEVKDYVKKWLSSEW